MKLSLRDLLAYLETHEGKKRFRYTMVSVITTFVSLAAIFVVFGVLHVWSETPSTIFGNAVATFPSYWLNRAWAWEKNGKSHFRREVLPFWTVSALGIAFSILGSQAARHLGRVYQLPHLEQTALVLFANVMSFLIFWPLKLMIFNKLFHVHPTVDDEDLVAA